MVLATARKATPRSSSDDRFGLAVTRLPLQSSPTPYFQQTFSTAPVTRHTGPLHCLPLLLPTNIAYRGVFPTSITDSPHHSTIFRHLAEPYRILEPQIYLRLPSEPFDGMFYSEEAAGVATPFQLSNPEDPSKKLISDVGRLSH